MDLDILQNLSWHRLHRRTTNIDCPGGEGKFGFNSYDLLTFAVLSFNIVSNVITNTNKNENNNNNNENQGTFGAINTNSQTSSATQSSMNMVMIIVDPLGNPIIIPGGRMLATGEIELNPGVEIPGVSFKSKDWIVSDDGTVLDGTRRKRKGVLAFGTVDSNNVFHLLPRINNQFVDFKLLRDLNSARIRKQRKLQNHLKKDEEIPIDSHQRAPPILEVGTDPVLVMDRDINFLYREAILERGSVLIMLALVPAGPPIVINIGAMLDDGTVLLEDGMEVDGVYWESDDRILFDNGTLIYKLSNITEQANIKYGTINKAGVITLLPRKIEGEQTSISLLRALNSRRMTRNFESSSNLNQTTLNLKREGLFDDILDNVRKALTSLNPTHTVAKREIHHFKEFKKLKFLLSFLGVLSSVVESDSQLEYLVDLMICAFLLEGSNGLYDHTEVLREQCIIFPTKDNLIEFCKSKTIKSIN